MPPLTASPTYVAPIEEESVPTHTEKEKFRDLKGRMMTDLTCLSLETSLQTMGWRANDAYQRTEKSKETKSYRELYESQAKKTGEIEAIFSRSNFSNAIQLEQRERMEDCMTGVRVVALTLKATKAVKTIQNMAVDAACRSHPKLESFCDKAGRASDRLLNQSLGEVGWKKPLEETVFFAQETLPANFKRDFGVSEESSRQLVRDLGTIVNSLPIPKAANVLKDEISYTKKAVERAVKVTAQEAEEPASK